MQSAFNSQNSNKQTHFDSILSAKWDGGMLVFLIKDDCVRDTGKMSVAQYQSIIGTGNSI